MFLRPVLGACMRPKFYSSIKDTRSLRPSIKISKDTFQLSVDVHHFKKDEIRVRAHPEYLVIEGKQEKDTQQGYVQRQFIRKFKMPEGSVLSEIKCNLAPDGMLTVTVPRSFKDSSTPAEVVVVPISHGGGEKTKKVQEIDPTSPPPASDSIPKVYVNPCKNFPKITPCKTKK